MMQADVETTSDLSRGRAADPGFRQAWIDAAARRQLPPDGSTSGEFALSAPLDGDGRLVAVDRFARRTLCWTTRRGRFEVSERADALGDGTLDAQALFDYLFFHMIPSPRTVFRGVQRLPPGHLALARGTEVEVRPYADLRFRPDASRDFASLKAEFRRLLVEAVQCELERGVPACYLSGGTDSSTVAGHIRQVAGEVHTYAIGFDAEGYDESGYARITVDRFRTEHHHYYVTPQDVVDALPLVAAYYDEPFGNASAVPAYFCAKLAREAGIRNMLAGDGGDEIFGGNTRYVKQKVFEHWQRVPGVVRRALIEPLAMHFPLGERIAPVRKLRSYIAQANIPLPDRLETYNFLHRESLGEIFTPDFIADIDPEAPLAAQRAVYAAADCDSSLNRMLFLDMKFTMDDNDIRKVNGMCEMAGVNVHYPLIDLDMVRFAARVPVDMKIKGHKLRWFFKYALKDTLAPETLTKSKHGFGLPFGVWLNDDPALHRMATESLERLKGRGYLRPEYIDSLWARHRTEHSSYYGTMIWICMMFEQWLEAHT